MGHRQATVQKIGLHQLNCLVFDITADLTAHRYWHSKCNPACYTRPVPAPCWSEMT